MSEEKRCAQCGAALTADAPHGLCPACLLKRGFASSTGAGESDNRGPRTEYVPPPVAELASFFPELEILGLIGRGGMGVVYKARQKRLDRLVALKILPPNVSRDAAFSERFTREAKALARLTHPNIVTVHDFGQTDGLFYFVMEFVDGMNLRQLLDTGKLSPKEALAIVPQICDALQYAHDKGIVHRDIKPENILIDKSGVVKIADFGLAKLVGLEAKDLTITSARDVIGTPLYMAPEQVEHPQDVDHRADIYSLGVVFYQMLTGELPIGRFAPPSRKVHIDVRLDEVVLRALEKEPEHRYQHASEVKTQVETIAQTEGIKSEGRESKTDARLCGTAIAGACLMSLFLVSAFFWDFGHLGGLPALVGILVTTLGFVAILGTTILGWVAVSQIRRSEGRLYGMWLALTDGLVIPVLLLDILIVLGLLLTNKLLNHWLLARWYPDLEEHAFLNLPHSLIWLLFATAVVTAVDYALIRRVWRAVNRPVVAPAPTVQKPDRFWRWFATIVVALIASPFVIIALLTILTPLFIVFFEGHERAQKANQQTVQDAAAMPEQQALAESGGARFTTRNFYIGQAWFPKGDLIEITSVVRTADRISVRGRYSLVSHDAALLALYITSTNSPGPEEVRQRMQISKGAGYFELVHTHPVPGLPHVSMYADGHPFASVYFGTKPEALEESQASWITNTPPPSAGTEEDLGQTVAGLPPVVIETQPVSGARDVEPGIAEIRVRFSKEMTAGSWSWCTVWENSTPEFITKPRYEADGRTCVVKVKLEREHTYAYWLNSGEFQNFTDRAGRPSVPYLLTFQTRSN